MIIPVIMIYKLEKPPLPEYFEEMKNDKAAWISPAERFYTSFGKHLDNQSVEFIKSCTETNYLYWDEVKYKKPLPNNVSAENLWLGIKTIRHTQRQNTPIKDQEGEFFTWQKLNYFDELLHNLDLNLGGEILVEKNTFEKKNKQQLVIRGIMEEAIASSQLEGAATSRQAAKKMLREGRKPNNKSEQMIVNNFLSLKAIEEKYKDQALSLELVLELHSLVTKDTVDSENEKPRLRKPDEPIYVADNNSDTIYYQAPDMNFVNKELQNLIDFANDKTVEKSFIHPVLKAIMLHFWMGYLHPFTDGNGRLARLLFYWYLLKKGYWTFAYLPISKVIKTSAKGYKMAYIYTEQDDNDLTYFLDYNVRKIKLAMLDFEKYLQKQVNKNSNMNQKSSLEFGFNTRQIQLLQYFNDDLNQKTTTTAYTNLNQITKATAIKDLKDLLNKGFLGGKKQGKNLFYFGTDKIRELFI